MTIDGSDAHEGALTSDTEAHGTPLLIRQVQYFNHIVNQDPRSVKRVTRPMVGLQSFDAAQDTLGGIELLPMSTQRQMRGADGDAGLTAAALFTPWPPIPPQTGATAPARPPVQNLRHNHFLT